MTDIQFRPVTPEDFTLLRGWLADPEVIRWFGTEAFLDQISGYLRGTAVRPLIASAPTGPFAYIHHCRVHAFDDHPLAFLPDGARGIDCFIGPDAARDRGLGTAMVQALGDQLLAAGVPALGIDPVVENLRAIACYRRAGFEPHSQRVTDEGLSQLMTRWP